MLNRDFICIRFCRSTKKKKRQLLISEPPLSPDLLFSSRLLYFDGVAAREVARVHEVHRLAGRPTGRAVATECVISGVGTKWKITSYSWRFQFLPAAVAPASCARCCCLFALHPKSRMLSPLRPHIFAPNECTLICGLALTQIEMGF